MDKMRIRKRNNRVEEWISQGVLQIDYDIITLRCRINLSLDNKFSKKDNSVNDYGLKVKFVLS